MIMKLITDFFEYNSTQLKNDMIQIKIVKVIILFSYISCFALISDYFQKMF